MAKINAINNRSGELTIDPGASGDSFLQFDINSTGEFRIGVDDDVADAFKMSQGSAFGANDTFIMTAAGERTMPLQSAFSAYLSSTSTNVTGDGTLYTIICDTEIFDQNSDYNTGSGVFTAPTTGRYCFTCTAFFDSDAAGGTANLFIRLFASNQQFNVQYSVPTRSLANFYGPNNNISMHGKVFVDMDTSDTAELRLFCSGGNKTDDLYGAAAPFTAFSGYLVC